MTLFQDLALGALTLWLLVVAFWFRRSTPVLIGGLILIGVGTAVAIALGAATLANIGLSQPASWTGVLVWAFGWLVLMLAYSPVADWLASRVFEKPPQLDAFRGLQQSLAKLIVGIAIAWLLGAILEEIVFRGVALNAFRAAFQPLGDDTAIVLAIVAAALGAGVVHLYQGLRAALIITQLSALFGVLFVVSGFNLWTVILCHGAYDTIAFIRFAVRKSKYSTLDNPNAARSVSE